MVCRSELPSPQLADIFELAPPPIPPSPEVPELCGELEEAGDHGLSYRGNTRHLSATQLQACLVKVTEQQEQRVHSRGKISERRIRQILTIKHTHTDAYEITLHLELHAVYQLHFFLEFHVTLDDT